MTKTYAQLAREIETLRAVAQKQLAIETQSAVEKINEVIAKYGLTADDLTFPAGSALPSSSVTPVKRQRPSSYKTANFSDGKGNDWSGRGPRPAWLRSAIAAGRSLESFRSSGANAATSASPKPEVSAPATGSARKAAAVDVAAKYRDPASGSTWSGRGPRPQWLKKALKKRGSAVGDFLVSEAPSSLASQPASVSSSPAGKRTQPAKRAPQKPRPAAKPGRNEEVPAPKAAVKKAVTKTAAKRSGAQGAVGATSEVKDPVKQAAPAKRATKKTLVQPAARKRAVAKKAQNAAASAPPAVTRAGVEAPAEETIAAQAPLEPRMTPEPMTPEAMAAAAGGASAAA